jgi:hypothetical protein
MNPDHKNVLKLRKSPRTTKRFDMAKIAIIAVSGYGHTQKQAEAVHQGAASAQGATAALIEIDEAPRKGDLETAKIFGKRVAEYAVKTRG